jgi:hypothetical protein
MSSVVKYCSKGVRVGDGGLQCEGASANLKHVVSLRPFRALAQSNKRSILPIVLVVVMMIMLGVDDVNMVRIVDGRRLKS